MEKASGPGLDPSRPTPVPPWGALTLRDFKYFWTSALFGNVSRFMREMLSYYLIYEISGSPVQLGLTGLFQAVPVVILGLIGGSMADAVNRKKLIFITQAVGLVPAVALAALVFTDSIAVWHLWVLTSLTSAANVMANPAQRSFFPRLVPRSHLMNAVTLYSVSTQGSLLLGPLLAGVLAGWLGIGVAFVITGVLQGAAMLTLLGIRTSGMPEGAVNRRAVSLTAIVEGLRFLQTQKIIWAGFLIDFGVMAAGFYRILLPVVADDMFGVGIVGLGALNSAPAVGSAVATVLLLGVGDIRPKGMIIVSAYVLYSLFLILLGLSPWFWLAVVAVAGLGAADMISYTVRQTVTQLVAPDDFRGRTAAASQISASVANTTGAMQIGFVTALLGVSGALMAGGVVGVALAVLITYKMRDLWRYRT